MLQVYMMDKRFLDPRRPLGTPTKEDQAEMLVPYDVELPLNPQFFATNQHQVANLAGGPHILACRVYDTPQQSACLLKAPSLRVMAAGFQVWRVDCWHHDAV